MLFPPKLTSAQTGTQARLEMDQLFLGLLLLNTENCGFSTSGREELFFFSCGEMSLQKQVPCCSSARSISKRCLSPTEGTLKLEIREPPGASPSAAPCSWITLGMGWDGADWHSVPSHNQVTVSPCGTRSGSSTSSPGGGVLRARG